MADNGSILITGAAGQLGAVGRTVTRLLLERGLPVRAMVRREDDRAAALRAAGAEVVVGDLLEPASGKPAFPNEKPWPSMTSTSPNAFPRRPSFACSTAISSRGTAAPS